MMRSSRSLYGTAGLHGSWQSDIHKGALTTLPSPGQPVRVGIVSGYFRDHSNWKIPIKGWLSQLDRKRFQIFGYHTGVKTDVETKLAMSLCDRFVQGPLSIDSWRKEILGDAPHVLIYPEAGVWIRFCSIGGPTPRFRTVQFVGVIQTHQRVSHRWTAITWCISDGARYPQEHYTERLVRLPNLSIYYDEPAVPGVALSREEHGLRPETTVSLCGPVSFKYLHQYDEVFPRIAREVGNCQFALLSNIKRGKYVGGSCSASDSEKSFLPGFGMKKR